VDEARLVKLSKYLSKHLRHQPARLGLVLEPGGWVETELLLKACAQHGMRITQAELEEVVAKNDKQRFAFDASGARIRANQGHSVEVDLQLQPVEPPAVLYHGTARQAAEAIRERGILKMKRHHVHLSPDVDTARRVGARRGQPVIFEVDARAMHANGYVFFRTTNDVWLVDEVPPAYLRELAASPA
jgi:putative RNA 2'-phosphotransferase